MIEPAARMVRQGDPRQTGQVRQHSWPVNDRQERLAALHRCLASDLAQPIELALAFVGRPMNDRSFRFQQSDPVDADFDQLLYDPFGSIALQ